MYTFKSNYSKNSSWADNYFNLNKCNSCIKKNTVILKAYFMNVYYVWILTIALSMKNELMPLNEKYLYLQFLLHYHLYIEAVGKLKGIQPYSMFCVNKLEEMKLDCCILESFIFVFNLLERTHLMSQRA